MEETKINRKTFLKALIDYANKSGTFNPHFYKKEMMAILQITEKDFNIVQHNLGQKYCYYVGPHNDGDRYAINVSECLSLQEKYDKELLIEKIHKGNNMNKILIALIAIIPACLTAILGYMQGYKSTDFQMAKSELTEKRVSFQRSSNPNFKELIYPNYGISLMAPVSWTAEDSPAVLAGGEFNLISRYEDTRGAVGMNFRLRPVQPNYINNISAQIENQRLTFERNFPGTTVEDITLSGLAGKLFIYTVKTGKREMKVRLYWIRLIPDVQLQIQVAQYSDAADYEEFWKQVDQILSSIVIAFDSWQARYKALILPNK